MAFALEVQMNAKRLIFQLLTMFDGRLLTERYVKTLKAFVYRTKYAKTNKSQFVYLFTSRTTDTKRQSLTFIEFSVRLFVLRIRI